MPARRLRRILHDLFEASVVLKLLHGSAEIVVGLIIVFVNRNLALDVLTFLSGSRYTLLTAPARYLSHQITPSSETFMGVYFLFFGVTNVFLAISLLRDRLWAYPATVGFILFFMGYEVFRVSHTHSPVLMGLIVFDAVVAALVWNEYAARKKTP